MCHMQWCSSHTQLRTVAHHMCASLHNLIILCISLILTKCQIAINQSNNYMKCELVNNCLYQANMSCTYGDTILNEYFIINRPNAYAHRESYGG